MKEIIEVGKIKKLVQLAVEGMLAEKNEDGRINVHYSNTDDDTNRYVFHNHVFVEYEGKEYKTKVWVHEGPIEDCTIKSITVLDCTEGCGFGCKHPEHPVWLIRVGVSTPIGFSYRQVESDSETWDEFDLRPFVPDEGYSVEVKWLSVDLRHRWDD